MTYVQFRQPLGRNTFFSFSIIRKTARLRTIFAVSIILSVLSSPHVYSDQNWNLISSEGGHRIATNDANLSQLSLAKQDESFTFVLTLVKDTQQPVTEDILSTQRSLIVIIRVDAHKKWVGHLLPSIQSTETARFEIELNAKGDSKHPPVISGIEVISEN